MAHMSVTAEGSRAPETEGDSSMTRREQCKRRLAEAYRILGRFGYAEGTAGHISVRDPIDPERFWAAPYGMHFSLVRVRDLVLTDVEGNLYVGSAPAHPAALPFHGVVHAFRPDVQAAVHAHTDYGRAMAAIGGRIKAISQDACAFWDDTAYLDSYGGVVLTVEEGERIGRTLAHHKAMLLRNHGIFTVGGSVDEAVWWFLSLEKVCKVQLVAQAAGTLIEIDEPVRSETASLVGSAGAAQLNAAPLFEWIGRCEPDLYT
jgi:ribulose-5-phosphate 4-epimerase/fuculose-1-phosphate aldolase